MDYDKMKLDVDSDNWIYATGSVLINTFKNAYLFCFNPILNIAFPGVANLAFGAVQD